MPEVFTARAVRRVSEKGKKGELRGDLMSVKGAKDKTAWLSDYRLMMDNSFTIKTAPSRINYLALSSAAVHLCCAFPCEYRSGPGCRMQFVVSHVELGRDNSWIIKLKINFVKMSAHVMSAHKSQARSFNVGFAKLFTKSIEQLHGISIEGESLSLPS